MAELWVAVDADAGDDVSFHHLRDALDAGADSPRTVRGYGRRVAIAEAVGLVTLLYGRALRKAPDGDIGAVPDGALESWACWEGEPGIFAQAFRRHFAPDGHIVTWDEVAGRLLKYREKEAERKRLARERERLRALQTSGGLSADAAADTPPDAPGTVRARAGGLSTGSGTGPGAGRAHSDSDRDRERNPTPSRAVRAAVVEACTAGHLPEFWFAKLSHPALAADGGIAFWRAMQRIADAVGAGSLAFYLEDLHGLLVGKHGTRVALEDAIRGLDQFSTDSRVVKRQTFQNWVAGGEKPPGGGTGASGRPRVDARAVFDDTVALLEGTHE